MLFNGILYIYIILIVLMCRYFFFSYPYIVQCNCYFLLFKNY